MILRRIPPTGYLSVVSFELLEEVNVRGYTVPAGFITDGLTLPRVIRTFYSPLGRGFFAAVLHDFLLLEKKLSRKECAHEFHEALKEAGVSSVVRRIMFYGVRLNDLVRH